MVHKDFQNKFCWNSDGKGRLEGSFGRFVFNYESSLKIDDQTGLEWLLGLQFPLKGESVLTMHSKLKESKVALGGSFYKELLFQTNNNVKKRKKLDNIFLKISQYFKTGHVVTQKIDSHSASFGLIEKQKETLLLTGSALNKGYFEKVEIEYLDEVTRESLKMLLFVRECHK